MSFGDQKGEEEGTRETVWHKEECGLIALPSQKMGPAVFQAEVASEGSRWKNVLVEQRGREPRLSRPFGGGRKVLLEVRDPPDPALGRQKGKRKKSKKTVRPHKGKRRKTGDEAFYRREEDLLLVS